MTRWQIFLQKHFHKGSMIISDSSLEFVGLNEGECGIVDSNLVADLSEHLFTVFN